MLSSDVQQKFLAYSKYFPNQGLQGLVNAVQQAATLALAKYAYFY